jgi:hypothetical protein
MDATALDYQTRNPSRPVDYRWRAAVSAVVDRRPLPWWHDPETAAAVDYLRERDQTTVAPERLGGHWPGLLAAHRLSGDDGPQRWEVQARLLSGQTEDEIAARSGLTPDTVRWFEALFFRVRDRLHARDWVAAQVLGGRQWCGFAREQLGKVWMLLGYNAGPHVLDAVVAVTRDRPLPAWVRAPAGEAPRVYEARLRLSYRLAVAALMLRSAADADMIRQLYRAKCRLERAAGLRDAPDRTLETRLDLLAGVRGKRRRSRTQQHPGQVSPTGTDAWGGKRTKRRPRPANQLVD